jgi:hypothetical protein
MGGLIWTWQTFGGFSSMYEQSMPKFGDLGPAEKRWKDPPNHALGIIDFK